MATNNKKVYNNKREINGRGILISIRKQKHFLCRVAPMVRGQIRNLVIGENLLGVRIPHTAFAAKAMKRVL